MDVLAISLRSVIRGVVRAPGFTLGVVSLLTLGLGINAVTYGLVDRLVLSGPAGIEAADQLRRVVLHRKNRSGAEVAITDLGYLDYRDLLNATQLAGAAAESSSPLLFGSGEAAQRVQALLVTANYFGLLGVSPAVGRFFTADESEREGARVAVLSHSFWQRRFDGDPAVIGQVLPIEAHRYLIVGIAPRHFSGTAVRRVDLFLPLEAAADEQVSGPWRTSRNFSWIGAVVRLRPEAADTAAASEATALYRQGHKGVTGVDPTARIELAPLNAVRGAAASGELGVAALVGGVAMIVLLIAFANVANLFLARALRRHDQIAVRLALGGGRFRLMAEQAGEGAVLALVGATAAVIVAIFGARPIQTLLFPDVAWLDTTVDSRLLVLVASIAVAGGGIAAALPMWLAGRTGLIPWLRSAQRVSRTRTRTQGVMLAAQGALSVLLLVGAGLFVRSLAHAQALDLGIETGHLLVVSALRGEMPPRNGFRESLRAGVERIPGVAQTTRVAGTMPFVSSWAVRLNVPGLPEKPTVDDGGPYLHAVEPGYFAIVGTTIEEGRPFNAQDREGSPRVAIVNTTMARLYWPGEPAIGKCLQIGPDEPPCATVVGVAENTRRQEIVEGESLLYYIPLEQAPADLRNGGRLLVRTLDDDADTLARVAGAIRRHALALEPGLRHVTARPLDEVISPQLRAWRLGAGLFSAFGVLALVVAAVGLYSVVAFDVEGRRREMGVRTALGASTSSILRLVVRDGLRLSAGGLVLGLALAWLLAPLVSGLLYGTGPLDAGVFTGVAAVLVGAAIVASAIPALRAAHIDPSEALRDQ